MKILFIDTETTGLPTDFYASYKDVENWPRLVQCSWIIKDYDTGARFDNDYIIFPEPEVLFIPKESTKIHGITTRMAREWGKCLYGVLRLLQEDLNKADLIVAHNFRFDSHIIMAEAIRKKNDEIIKAFREKRSFDTMLFCTDLCKIEKEGGVYKWPKLSELYRFLFNKDFQGAHNSLNDIRATMEIYDELKERGLIDETTYTEEPYL